LETGILLRTDTFGDSYVVIFKILSFVWRYEIEIMEFNFPSHKSQKPRAEIKFTK